MADHREFAERLKLACDRNANVPPYGKGQQVWFRDRFTGTVCDTTDEVREFFGHRWLAKELYTEAGIKDVVEVE